MKDQRWANRPDAVARRPDKRRRVMFALLAFVAVAGMLTVFERVRSGGAPPDHSGDRSEEAGGAGD